MGREQQHQQQQRRCGGVEDGRGAARAPPCLLKAADAETDADADAHFYSDRRTGKTERAPSRPSFSCPELGAPTPGLSFFSTSSCFIGQQRMVMPGIRAAGFVSFGLFGSCEVSTWSKDFFAVAPLRVRLWTGLQTGAHACGPSVAAAPGKFRKERCFSPTSPRRGGYYSFRKVCGWAGTTQ